MSTLSLRLPDSIHRHIKDIAKREGVSINQFISTAVSEKISAILTEEYLRSRAERAKPDTLKTILGRIEPIANAERPKVYYARGPRGLSTGLGGSINVETIEMLGRNVAGETQGGLANVSIEQVLVWNPDVIVTIDQEFAATVRNDPSWAAAKAVRDNRIHLSPKMPFGWVDFPPSVNRLIGLWWLAKILYPERFPADLRTLTSDFYTRFYHVTPSSSQIDHVLAGRD